MKDEANLSLYNEVRDVPKEAQKEIKGGRLSGMTDINPMFRIKTLTEQFGICGIGWRAPITEQWLDVGANGEIVASVKIKLQIKVDGVWSEGIDGIGGSMFVAKEKNGMYTSDEAYKMAYTDAISVACKMLGVGADIYWQKDRTKYDTKQEPKAEPKPEITKAMIDEAVQLAKDCQNTAELTAVWKQNAHLHNVEGFRNAVTEKGVELKGNQQ